MPLPILSIKDELLKSCHTSHLVLTAPTGSGKSTQVPQYLLSILPPGKQIIVLQPRRLAARMLAERVASELGTPLGSQVGYQTKYESSFSAETQILFITEGILTRLLLSNPTLPKAAFILFDEFHERSLNTDLGLAMAYQASLKRADLRLIVMSATIDAAPISQYLGNCPILHAEGQLFPVTLSYCTQELKQQGVAVAAARSLKKLLTQFPEGDVLIFMPGHYEILKTIEACKLTISEPLLYLPLYGTMPPDAQRQVMEPATTRKVIVATNVAETSLTIPGIRLVIDSGLARISKFNAMRGINTLETLPIAKDSAAQRSGRAGREAPGYCLRLWTELEQSAKPAQSLPEILRADLAEAVLAVKAYGYSDASRFPWFQAPPEKMLISAEKLLLELGFIAAVNAPLTPLGKKLQSFPAHPRLSRLMDLGARYGCLKETAQAAALLTEKPILLPGASASASHQTQSDFYPLFALLETAQKNHFNPVVCNRLGLNSAACKEVCRNAQELLATVSKAHWPVGTPTPDGFLKCMLLAFPDRLACRRSSNAPLCDLADAVHADLSPSSVVQNSRLFVSADIRANSSSNGKGSKSLLCLNSAIEEEWLIDEFESRYEDRDELFYDTEAERVFRRQSTWCLGVCLDSKIRTDPDLKQAAELLAQRFIASRQPFPGWDSTIEQFVQRVHFLAALFPEQHLPLFDEAYTEPLKKLCYGETSLKNIKNKESLSAFKQCLTPAQNQFVETMAPTHLPLPNGRRMRIFYAANQTPKGSARIQDLYDVKATPTIANGRVPLLLDILAPNMRTVQITNDLANFWNSLYPKIKPALARRYPKHLWK